MAFGTVDDRFYDHDKVLRMPREVRNAASGLYWRAISYSNAKLTDGFVHESVLVMLDATEAEVDALLEARLWRRRKGGYGIYGFFKDGRNRSRAEVEASRNQKVEAGRLGGLKSGETRRKSKRRTKREAGASNPVELPVPSPSPESLSPLVGESERRRSRRSGESVAKARDLVPIGDLLEPALAGRTTTNGGGR